MLGVVSKNRFKLSVGDLAGQEGHPPEAGHIGFGLIYCGKFAV
jgi:hypothetical protein